MDDLYKQLLARNNELEEGDGPDLENLSPAERRAHYQKLVADASATFKAQYGFPHDCSCAVDYAVGNVEIVPNCFLEMVDEAMKRIAVYFQFQKQVKGMLQEDRDTWGWGVPPAEGAELMLQLNDKFNELMKGLEGISGV